MQSYSVCPLMSGLFCNVIKVHPWGSICPNFIPSYGVNSRQVKWAKQGYSVWPFTTVAQSKAVREKNSQEKTRPSPKAALKHILRPFVHSDFLCSVFSCMLGTLGPLVFQFGIHLFPVLLNSVLAARCSKASTRDCWLGRKDCFIQEAGNLGRRWTHVQEPTSVLIILRFCPFSNIYCF